jgi:hypothetical protein
MHLLVLHGRSDDIVPPEDGLVPHSAHSVRMYKVKSAYYLSLQNNCDTHNNHNQELISA